MWRSSEEALGCAPVIASEGLSPRSVFLLALCGGAIVAGCALHDWDGYSSGVATVSTEDGGTPDSGTAVIATDSGEAGGLDTYGVVVQADSPIAWYRFEEPIGTTTVTDVAGKYPGKAETTAYFGATGVAGHGVTLDGTGGFDLGDVFDFAGKNSFTLEAWVRSEILSTADQRLMFKRDDGNSGGGYVLYLGGDHTPHFEVAGAGMSSWSNTAIPTTFTHIVVTVAYIDSIGNATLWFNGQRAEYRGFNATEAIPDTPEHYTMGTSLKGTLDEVAIYDKALTDARILAHYLAGSAGQ